MLTDEYGLSLHPLEAWRAVTTTFVALVLAGLVPLLPFVVGQVTGRDLARPVVWSAVMTSVTFALVGALRARFRRAARCGAAAEAVLLGGAAAGLAFAVGVLLRGGRLRRRR